APAAARWKTPYRGSRRAAAAGKPQARRASPGPAVPPRLPPSPPAFAPRYREDRADGISPRVIAQEGAMGRARIIVIAAAALVAGVAASPAWAANGALAHEEDGGKYGLSSNEENQAKAVDVAMKICGEKCKIVFRTAPKQCGAIAIAEGGSPTWGAGKGPAKAAAELDAVTNCQKRT